MRPPVALVAVVLVLAACASSEPRHEPAMVATTASASPAPVPPSAPAPSATADVPAEPPSIAAIDVAVEGAIARRDVPGAVVVVVRDGAIVHRKAYGWRAKEPRPIAMTVDTVFDLASLTKPLATTLAIFALVEEGKLRLGDPVAKYLPKFARNGKAAITFEQLLLHTSGLPADNALRDYAAGPAAARERIANLALDAEPGTTMKYSDVGFIVLGEVVEAVSGERLDAFVRGRIYAPLGLRETGFMPGPELVARAAPTERVDGASLQGIVHDPRARKLGGVAGHAGLFASADDLAILARMLLAGGAIDQTRVLKPETLAEMRRPRAVPGGARALGWDALPNGGYGHTGFTGTSIAIDPSTKTATIVLSNRLHPDGKGDARRLRREIAEAVAGAPREVVRTGLDVLEADGFRPVAGRSLGVVTNAAAVDRLRRPVLEVLAHAPGVRIEAIFAPEHGIAVAEDRPLRDGKDAATGARVVALFGPRTKPTDADLAGVELLVIDLPNVGARFFTYVSTLGLVLEAAAAKHIPVVVLDRPDVVGADVVEGPVLDAQRTSFVGYHPLPVRFGMTMGELAKLFVAERRIPADLTVVAMQGYDRRARVDATGVPWVDPSPNLRSVTAALLYPGVALLELTNVSVGRGTRQPFEIVGAPWANGAAIVRELRREGLAGVSFEPTTFTPSTGPFANEACGGVAFHVTNPEALAPLRLGVALALALRRAHHDAWKPEGLGTLVGDEATVQAIRRGDPLARITASWKDRLDAFREVRENYLLYK